MNKAVVMAGGFGTRLRPLSMNIPKPMVPIANKPMMEHIVNLLKRNGIKDVVSLLYFQPEKITSYFEDGAKYGINMNYVSAKADYGTAGSVRNAKEFLDVLILSAIPPSCPYSWQFFHLIHRTLFLSKTRHRIQQTTALLSQL